MIRRILWTTLGVTLLMSVFYGHEAMSYFKTSGRWLKDSAKGSVPLSFEIDRARGMVRDLMPDIRKNMHVIAQEEVEVERLDKQIAETDTRLSQEQAGVLKLKGDLAGGAKEYSYGGRTFTVQQVKVDLSNRFERYKTHEATLASLREIKSARQKSLDAARQKLEGMLASKRQLEVDVENLEARLKMVEVAQTTSSASFDDSQLGRAKELVADLRARLSVSERVLAVENQMQEEIPINASAPDNIVDQVTEYFGNQNGAPAKAGANVAVQEK